MCDGRLDEKHVALICPGLEQFRSEETELSFFRNLCRRRLMTEKETYRRLVNGFDWNGLKVNRTELAQRGGWLRKLKSLWLQLAGYRVYSIVSTIILYLILILFFPSPYLYCILYCFLFIL